MEFDDEEIDDFLEHYGVKGMKWGKRNQKRLARATRVSKGKGSVGDNVRFALTDASAFSISRNQDGLRGAAKNRSVELAGRKARINAGKANVRDYLALKGADRLVITGGTGQGMSKGTGTGGSKAKSGKKRPMQPETKVAIAAGSIFVAQRVLAYGLLKSMG